MSLGHWTSPIMEVGRGLYPRGRPDLTCSGLYWSRRRRFMVRVLAAFLVLLAASVSLAATPTTQTSTWTDGGGNSNWATAANWAPSGIPKNGANGISDYTVVIGAPSPTNIIKFVTTIDSLILNSSGTLNVLTSFNSFSQLTVTDNLTNGGELSLSSSELEVNGTTSNSGTLVAGTESEFLMRG